MIDVCRNALACEARGFAQRITPAVDQAYQQGAPGFAELIANSGIMIEFEEPVLGSTLWTPFRIHLDGEQPPDEVSTSPQFFGRTEQSHVTRVIGGMAGRQFNFGCMRSPQLEQSRCLLASVVRDPAFRDAIS